MELGVWGSLMLAQSLGSPGSETNPRCVYGAAQTEQQRPAAHPRLGALGSPVLMTDTYLQENAIKSEYNCIHYFYVKHGDFTHPPASSTKSGKLIMAVRNSIYCTQLASKALSTEIFSSILFKYR